jgi:arylsulfatase A-like enzyme
MKFKANQLITVKVPEKMGNRIPNVATLLCLCVSMLAYASSMAAPKKPNIIVILADDMGWGDAGFNGCKEIPTPHLDKLASSGVVFPSGYASHSYCSPSRAGLMTGRYQQRFGHESNPEANETDGTPLTETFLPEVLKQAGYKTGHIGKWHLGDALHFWPTQRGFDEWYGFSGGARSFWGSEPQKKANNVLRRNGEPVPLKGLGHLTDVFTDEALSFVEKNRDQPFFLYLAYNAPHSPDHATLAHLKRTEHIEYGGRAVYGAMVAAMDDGIGRLIGKLEELKLRENTLIFFYSDNGGRAEHAVNYPYRGHKGMVFEGGIRVPFLASWPARIPAGQKCEQPVTGLDVFPTSLAAAGVAKPEKLSLDGVNWLPALVQPGGKLPERPLFWRYACGDGVFGRAVRDGDYKLVDSAYKGKKLLFNLKSDPYEINDLAPTRADLVSKLSAQYAEWEKNMLPPKWLDPHGVNVRKEEAARQAEVDAAHRGESK